MSSLFELPIKKLVAIYDNIRPLHQDELTEILQSSHDGRGSLSKQVNCVQYFALF